MRRGKMIWIKPRSFTATYAEAGRSAYMTTAKIAFFKPGWDTPVAIQYDKPSFLAWFLGFADARKYCLARRQGKCPGLDHCHDCAWSSQEST
jgi:hypothetical protein